MNSLVASILRRLREHHFLREIRPVLETPPITARADGLVLFSMIGTRVLLPYLVAIKSLHHHLQRGRVVILDDGTLTDEDRAILGVHCDSPRIISIADVDTGPCPRGGTWERLLTILDLRHDDYVIQLDSDTVCIGAVPEVRDCVENGRSFTLRGDADAEILPIEEIARRHGNHPRVHVQAAVESRMDQVTIAGRESLRYVRGCSGFTGFAPETSGRALAEQFSAAAEALLGGEKWSEWGSEQVTSNFVTANSDGAQMLPYDRYLNYWLDDVPPDARFIHFIGTYRFHRGAYLRAARSAIAAMRG